MLGVMAVLLALALQLGKHLQKVLVSGSVDLLSLTNIDLRTIGMPIPQMQKAQPRWLG